MVGDEIIGVYGTSVIPGLVTDASAILALHTLLNILHRFSQLVLRRVSGLVQFILLCSLVIFRATRRLYPGLKGAR